MRRLPDSELELMLIIWDAEGEVSRTDIQKELEKSKELAPTTILSLLARLEKKEFVKVNRVGKMNYYYPLISQEEYAKNESKTVLERFFRNSVTNFVVHLNDANAVDEEQIKELREFLDNLSMEDKKK